MGRGRLSQDARSLASSRTSFFRLEHCKLAFHESIAVARERQAVLGPPILAPFEHQSQGTVMVWPTVGKYRLQVATVFPDASVSNLFLS